MRKKDDDLKIDISEFFGTDDSKETPVHVIPPKLDASQEDIAETVAVSIPPDLSSEEPAPRSPVATPLPIDFDAPIHPPFMGGAFLQVSAQVPTASGEKTTEANGSVPAAGLPAEINFVESEEFLKNYDELRVLIVREIADLVGERKTHAMLGRTVELAREKHPEILRNANWDIEGHLLEDGGINDRRVLENQAALVSSKPDQVLDAALSALLNLRLQAIEKGLGTGLKNKVRARLCHWLDGKIQKEFDAQKKKNFTRLRRYLP